MAPTNRQLLILLILFVVVFGFGFLVKYTITAFRDLSTASLNMAGIETSVSFNTVPVRITDLTADVHNGRVTLTWQPIMKSRLIGYRIYRGNASGHQFIIGGSNQPTFIDTEIKSGGTYYYRVTAINEFGEGRPSSPLRVEIR